MTMTKSIEKWYLGHLDVTVWHFRIHLAVKYHISYWQRRFFAITYGKAIALCIYYLGTIQYITFIIIVKIDISKLNTSWLTPVLSPCWLGQTILNYLTFVSNFIIIQFQFGKYNQTIYPKICESNYVRLMKPNLPNNFGLCPQ